jgi:hypothetical protein
MGDHDSYSDNCSNCLSPSFILPRDAGEDKGGGLNDLNVWNDLIFDPVFLPSTRDEIQVFFGRQ